MSFTYWLPDENGNRVDCTTESNAVIIVGANGSGKSKLGAWIEQKDFASVHRIAAQRSLNFSEDIKLMSYESAENMVLVGSTENSNPNQNKKIHKWGFSNNAKYTTTIVNDYEHVLAALLALNRNEIEQFYKQCVMAEQSNNEKPVVPTTVIQRLERLWNAILPQRNIIPKDSRFYTALPDLQQEYSATEMSDGERSILYFTAQVLCVPPGKILIIDEPELHLHRSIMNRLWKALEEERPDCLFIYITHDVQFAASHSHADKIWVREFDGKRWKYEKIESGELPEEMLLDILGSRKKVLFVEGERNSFDTQLYSEIYPEYYVVPCGSCTQVITRTKAFRGNRALHDNEVFGIIDRDFRSEHEVTQYGADGIYAIKVAEVENLFIVEALIKLFASHMGLDANDVFHKVKNYVINRRFAKQIEGQICESVVAQIKYKLSSAEISKKNEDEAKATLDEVLNSISFDSIKADEAKRFRDALDGADYAEILKLFNKKSIAGSVGQFFGVNNEEYQQMIIRLLHGKLHDEIVAALLPYMPIEIPRN